MNLTTILWVLFIVLCAIIAFVWILIQNKKGKLIEKRRWIEMLPSIISTLGVLGTFWGITVGLLDFDTQDINASIPTLLNGLKTAFFTSLAGMIGSLILSRLVSRLYDEADKGVSDINIAAGQITQAVKDMSQTLTNNSKQQAAIQNAFYNNVNTVIGSIQSSITNIDNVINQLLVLQTTQGSEVSLIQHELSSMQVLFQNISNQTSSLANNLQEIDEQVAHLVAEETSPLYIALAKVNSVDSTLTSTLPEIMSIVEGIPSGQSEMSDELKSLKKTLHSEVIDIEDKMKETNRMLEVKFDEFTKLLEKSNTEALVEVMKKVTEEFNKQMSELINKLVQENFEQLNKSVENLNKWQQENKAMIATLTTQYKDMQQEFGGTSKTLKAVGDETKELVASEGKLQKIVQALNKVMVEDEKFIAMTNNLTAAAELNKASMADFKDAQSSLNEWVKKQRNFVEAVQVLMEKLEEIANINDYSEEFWNQTRQGMNDSIGIIRNGSRELQNQLEEIDGTFYERLNNTLAQLDACIQAMARNAGMID